MAVDLWSNLVKNQVNRVADDHCEPARILVVEDDGIIARHLMQILKRLGYQVLPHITNGSDAVCMAKTEPIDLVLMDIMLEGDLDGIQTAEKIHLQANIPIIFLTAYSDEKFFKRAQVTDPFGYVLKPFEERNLHATIEMALQKHKLEMRLRESQDRYLAVIEQFQEGIVLFDPLSLEIMEANPAFERLIGRDCPDMLGRPIYAVLGLEEPAFGELLRRVLQEGLMQQCEQRTWHPDGSYIDLEIEIKVISYSQKKLVCALAHDITQRKQSQEQMQLQLRRLESLRAVGTSIITRHDLQSTLDTLVEQVVTQLKVDASSVLLLAPQNNKLEWTASRGFWSDAIKGTSLKLGEGFAGLAAAERRVVHASNLDNRYESEKFIPILLDEKFISYFGIPLEIEGEVKGVLEVFHRSRLEPTPDWLEYLKLIAGQAAIAIDNVTLFEEQRNANLRLARAYESTIEGWSRALELRDQETEGHAQRVSSMAVTLGRQLGLPSQELDLLHLGALLHDIGKMGIPDAILLKPGPLSADERSIMCRHPVYAYELLGPIEYLHQAIDIPFCHHERWDGTGYPRQLRGDDIPFLARIFAVIDVWDSLSNDQPFRSKWEKGKVQAYLRANSGIQFDPRVAEAFLGLDIWG